jgi:hypothetical protein
VSEGQGKITIGGLREFQRALKDMDTALPRQLRLVLNEAAGLVVDYAQAHIEVKSGRARSSLKAQSSQREARVALGGSRAPWAPWLDFGGEGRRRGRPSARPFIREGRYVYRGLRLHHEDITTLMADGLTELARSAGMEVS